MSGATAGQAIDLADRIRLLPSGPRPPAMLGESWDLIEEGIVRGLVVEIDYADVNRAVTNRRIEPLGLIGNDPHWYVIAWCQLRSAIRGFRADRISAARATGDSAVARPFEIGDDELAALVRPLNLLD
jgi:predicted DNA-binding transcriptional regulator YafY